MAKSINVLIMLILVLLVLESALANKLSSLSHADECSYLFQFKESISINKSASRDSRAYPKVASWNLNISDGTKNCCLWDGVECRFGHVIGLDLSSSFLYGPISSNNSLFNLIHLRTLNLADNNFSFSQIPSGIGQLSQLANLNLSESRFGGEFLTQISQLRNLVSLDLSGNYELKLQSSNFQTLVQNSSETLRELLLSGVEIDSELPASIGNLTHLNILDLSLCAFTGTLPASLSNLTQLTYLDLSFNEFTGRLPSLESFSNLTYLSLWSNNFDRWKLPDWFGKLNKITYLDLDHVNLYGEIPSSFFNLTHVEKLYLSNNQLKGQLSSSFLNFQNLESFYLDDNNVTVDSDLFLSLTKLKYLYLSGNNVKLSVIDSHTNETQPKFIYLGLASCNLKVIPEFLQFQNQLEYLFLDDNKIEGLIPRWMWNISKETLKILSLSQNLLMGFEQYSPIAPWVTLRYLNLSYNMLHGSIPVPPPTTIFYHVSNNNLTGEIPPSICDVLYLQVLELSCNNISGSIPPCLEKLSNSSLKVLNLRSNTLQGTIPNIFATKSKLVVIDLSKNKLEGEVPRSLENCESLRILDLGYNFIHDTFPFWLGALPELQVLILKFNKFHGIIRIPGKFKVNFPNVHIIDLSHNSFSGDLPYEYFQEWSAMKETTANATYMETLNRLFLNQNLLMGFEQHSPIAPWATLQHLDLSHNMLHGSIPVPPPTTVFYSVSNNNLTGEIPPSICDVLSLQVLDLSCNNITGLIPPCMEKLSNSSLQVLKLRSNTLQGTIPNLFTTQSKLVLIDLSENKLEGEVPRSLEKCESLQILDLGYNFIHDTFPFWLGALSELQVLILRFNKFHGLIRLPSKVKVNFPKLRIIDLSNNSFSGNLPYQYFQEWSAMKETTANATYMETTIMLFDKDGGMFYSYEFLFQITNKGHKMDYVKIPDTFFAIDLSSNMFRGKIPESIQTLSGLQLLNLSNNKLSGVIPSSIGNLTHLEALDLSGNKLYGMIPQDLVQLNFLEFFNVSNNNLFGHIPQGNQFNTFSNDTYIGNQALCGLPLSMKCGDSEESKPPTVSFKEDTESDFPNGIDWVVILIGVVTGLVIGIVCGDHLTTRYYKWFLQRFRE